MLEKSYEMASHGFNAILNKGCEVMELFSDNNYLLGIYSGLTVALLIYLFGKLLRFVKINILNKNIINVWFKSKILYVFTKSSEDTRSAIYNDAKASKIIYAFACNPSVFTDMRNKFFDLLKKDNCDFRFLFSDPDSKFVKKRENELIRYALADHIRVTIKTLENESKRNSNVKFALHNEQLRIGFFIFDDVMYLYFRLKGKLSSDSQIYKIGKESYLYKNIFEQFDDFWNEYYKP